MGSDLPDLPYSVRSPFLPIHRATEWFVKNVGRYKIDYDVDIRAGVYPDVIVRFKSEEDRFNFIMRWL